MAQLLALGQDLAAELVAHSLLFFCLVAPPSIAFRITPPNSTKAIFCNLHFAHLLHCAQSTRAHATTVLCSNQLPRALPKHRDLISVAFAASDQRILPVHHSDITIYNHHQHV